jgi:hypothetical protein
MYAKKYIFCDSTIQSLAVLISQHVQQGYL